MISKRANEASKSENKGAVRRARSGRARVRGLCSRADCRRGLPARIAGAILTDDDIWALIAYIKSGWPESIHRHHAEMFPRRD